MAAEVDLRAVASFTGIAEPHLFSLIASPTVELVNSLLQSIELKARDYEQVKTQKVRLEVELETSVRTNESKVKSLKKSVEKGITESSKLRIDLQNSGMLRRRPILSVHKTD
jgi:nucleoprotein TPR